MYDAPESFSGVPGTSVNMRSELKDPSLCSPTKHLSSTVLPLSEIPRSPLRSVQNIALETPTKSKPSPKRPSSGSRKKQRASLNSKVQFVIPLLSGANLENMDG
jgi:hypothetical protein